MQRVFGVRERDYRAEPEEVRAETAAGSVIAGRRMRQDFSLLPGEGRAPTRGTPTAPLPRWRRSAAAAAPGCGESSFPGVCGICSIRRGREIAGFARDCGIRPEIELPFGVIGRVLVREQGKVAVLSSWWSVRSPSLFRSPGGMRACWRAVRPPVERSRWSRGRPGCWC
ncbi:MAG: hypothetical protein L6W00_17615 [Lentisphaeria bacterium]|nr:MAG: hypothetical protein L6W00_17615 [Lentisphaeria bacterium]